MKSLVLTGSGQGPRRTDCRGTQGSRVADRGAVGGHAGPPPTEAEQNAPGAALPLPAAPGQHWASGPLANHDPPLPCLHAHPAWTSTSLAILSENPASALGTTHHPLYRLEKTAALTPAHAYPAGTGPQGAPPPRPRLGAAPWLHPGASARDMGPPAQPTAPPLVSLSSSGWLTLTHITAHSETSPAKWPQPHCPGATMDPKSSPYGHPPGLIRRPGPAWAPSLAAAGASGGPRFRDGRWRGSPQASQSTASSLSCWPLGPRPGPSGRAAQSHTHARAGFPQRSPRDIPLSLCQEPRMDPTKPRKVPGSAGQGRGDAHGEGSEQTGGAGSRGAAGPALCPRPPPAGPDAQSGHLSEPGLPTAKRL